MGRSLKHNETFDAFALFAAQRMRNPDDPAITTGWLDHVEGHPYGEAERAKARNMLARVIPYSRWREDNQPTSYKAQLWLLVVREIMKLAALCPDEEIAVETLLGIDEAEAAMEANNVGA